MVITRAIGIPLLVLIPVLMGCAGGQLTNIDSRMDHTQEMIRTDRSETRAENEALQKQNQKLSVEIKRLQQDEKYIEETARKKYGLLKKNEMVYEFDEPVKKDKK